MTEKITLHYKFVGPEKRDIDLKNFKKLIGIDEGVNEGVNEGAHETTVSMDKKKNDFKVTYNSLRDALDNAVEHANMQSHYGLIKITVK